VALASAAAVLVTAAVVAPMLMGQRLRAAQEHQRAQQVEDVLAKLFLIPGPQRMPRAPSVGELADHATRLVRRELDGQPGSRSRLLTMLGEVYAALGRYEASIDALEEAQSLRESEFGPDSLEVAQTLASLGQSLHYTGRYDAAERALRRSGAIRLARLGPDSAAAIEVHMALGDMLHTRGDLVAADEVLRGVIDRLQRTAPRSEPMARALRDHGNVLRDRGELARGEARFRAALALLREPGRDANDQVAITEVYFARLLVKRGALGEADALLARSLHALRLIFEGDHPLTAFALQNLGFLRMAQGRLDEAGQHFEEAQRVTLAWLGTEHPLVARIAADQAELARRQGRTAEAAALARRTLAHFERAGLANHPASIDTRWALGEALLAEGRSAEAAAILTRGLAVAQVQYVGTDPRLARARLLLARSRG
jgi:tetratricopeptide (TPR) repeat protein